jgi:hypothetical protein
MHRHFLRGPSGAIGSITTRTRTRNGAVQLLKKWLSWYGLTLEQKAVSGIRIRIIMQKILENGAVNAHNGGVERLKMETWRVCRPMVGDSYHIDEEQDPDTH